METNCYKRNVPIGIAVIKTGKKDNVHVYTVPVCTLPQNTT